MEQKLRIGAGVVLPYFSFKRDREKERTKEEQEVEIEAEKFSVKTKMALQYYEDLERKYNLKIFDSVYILGHDGYDVRGIYDTAGSGQHNLPHITEFYTAMAAVTFFRDKGDGKYFAVVPKDKINWRSMDESSNCFLSFFIMMRFAITMKSLILEELFDVAHDGQVRRKTINKIPWYFDFIDGKSRSLDLQLDSLKEKFSAIDEYCNRYIRWFAELMIDNIDKVKRPDTLNFLEKKGKKKDLSVEPDLVQYLDLFTGELLERQYANILMENGTLTYDTDKIKAKVREDNIRYIRRHSKEICQDVIMDELNMKKISFEDIWTRITMFGFSHTMKIDGILKNIRDTESPTMEEGVKNLVNAVYISCMA